MIAILVILVIGLPWIGAVAVWLARNSHAKLQHTLAVLFSVLTAATSLALLAWDYAPCPEEERSMWGTRGRSALRPNTPASAHSGQTQNKPAAG